MMLKLALSETYNYDGYTLTNILRTSVVKMTYEMTIVKWNGNKDRVENHFTIEYTFNKSDECINISIFANDLCELSYVLDKETFGEIMNTNSDYIDELLQVEMNEKKTIKILKTTTEFKAVRFELISYND